MQNPNSNNYKPGFARRVKIGPISVWVQPGWIAIALVFSALLLVAVVAMPDVLVALLLYAFGLLLLFVIIYRSDRMLDRLIATIKRDSEK